MAQISQRKLAQLNKLALEAAGMPVPKQIGELCAAHVEACVNQIKSLATTSPSADTRLEASKFIVQQANQHEKEQREAWVGCEIDIQKIQALSSAELQYDAIMTLYAGSEITKADVDVMLKVIDHKDAAVVSKLTAEKDALVKRIEELESETFDGKIATGSKRVHAIQ
ncbi:MAG: hypothetical protein AAAB35_18745 [Phyllobacterium sp.]|uniref:hypothetical protein n=1 Tax=Phyllobacterium sp. TaxID=1871046 RepID=UPI0030F27759